MDSLSQQSQAQCCPCPCLSSSGWPAGQLGGSSPCRELSLPSSFRHAALSSVSAYWAARLKQEAGVGRCGLRKLAHRVRGASDSSSNWENSKAVAAVSTTVSRLTQLEFQMLLWLSLLLEWYHWCFWKLEILQQETSCALWPPHFYHRYHLQRGMLRQLEYRWQDQGTQIK